MKIRLLIVVLLLSINTYGQEQQDDNSIANQFSKIVSVPNSPEAEAFEKYGNVDVNLHTGTPNISVPLYTIKGRELDIPISLTYDASGIKVDQVATNVGLGWNLNAGGRVSLQAKGLSDYYHSIAGNGYSSVRDQSTRDNIIKYSDNQYLEGANKDFTLNTNDVDFALSEVEDFYNFLEAVNLVQIDAEQDYYSVNILSLNETLYFDIESDPYKPKALNNKNIKVEYWLSGGAPPFDILGWKIIDQEGTQYFFGGITDGLTPYAGYNTGNNIEKTYRVDYNGDQGNNPITNLVSQYNNSWLVNKIISKNGKDVYYFSYTENPEFNSSEVPSIISQMTTHKKLCFFGSETEFEGKNIIPNNINVNSVSSKTTQQFISSIIHNGKEVLKFDFQDRDDLKNGVNKAVSGLKTYEDYNQDQTVIDKVNLNYNYFGTSLPQYPNDFYNIRLKLDKVIFDQGTEGENNYAFTYKSPHLIPNRTSFQRDTLGYYNGKANPTPFATYNDIGQGNLPYVLPGGDRSSSEHYTKIGVIEKIYYPTGGYSEFEFENHSDGVDIFPGLRIQSILNYSNTVNLASKKIYEYGNVYKPLEGKFDFVIDTQPTIPPPPSNNDNNACDEPSILYRYAFPPNISSGNYVSYYQVTEKLLDENNQPNGYTLYDFNNSKKGWQPALGAPPFEQYYYSSFKHGKLASKEVYNKDGNIVAKSTIEYTEDEDGDTEAFKTSKAMMFNMDQMAIQKFIKLEKQNNSVWVTKEDIIYTGNGGYTYPSYCNIPSPDPDVRCIPLLEKAPLQKLPIYINGYAGGVTKETKTEYFNGGNVSIVTDNQYSVDGTMKLINTINSIGNSKKIKKTYTYPQDISNPSSAQLELIEQNKTSIPLITETRMIDDSNNSEEILSTQEVEYELWNNDEFVLPKYVKTAKGDITTNNPLETRIIYQQYDQLGNPVDILLSNGAHTSYIWTFGGKHVAAKLENTLYSSISNSDKTAINNATNESNLNIALANLRTNMPNIQISSYSYKPMIGVSTIIDPLDNKITYKYDENHRLKYILDKNDKVISENTYNYGDGSELILTGGVIITNLEGFDNNGYFIDFEIDPSTISPSGSGPYNYLWESSNGTINTNSSNTVRVYFDCLGLNGAPLQVTCRISDVAENYYHLNRATSVIPELCTITADISYDIDHSNNIIDFSLENVSGGGTNNTYTYNWEIASNPSTGFSLVSASNLDYFQVGYNCNVTQSTLSVYCTITDGVNETILYKSVTQSVPPMCQIYATNGPNVDLIGGATSKILKFSIDVAGGVAGEYTYIWDNFGISSNADYLPQGIYNNVEYPYQDQDGNYFIRYECYGSGNITVSASVRVIHANGSFIDEDLNPTTVSGSCSQQ